MKSPRRLLVVLTILTAIVPAAAPALARGASSTKPSPKPPALGSTKAGTPHASAPAVIPGADDDPLADPLGVDAGILVDVSNGKVLWARDDTLLRPPASLTKILTALVVLRHAKLDDTQAITEDAYEALGAKTYAGVGWTYTVEDLLWGLLLVSGNDMAVALAHKVSPDGTVAGFVDLMNQEAAAFGATSTHVDNPHGMDASGHVSTARDMALLTMAAMRDPTFARIVGTNRHNIPWDGGVHDHLLLNHNKLLTLYPGTIGVKTGYTNGSGNSLASEATRNGATLLAVVLGAKSPAGYNDSMALYNWGFANLPALEARATDQIAPASPPLAAAAIATKGAQTAQKGAHAPVAAGVVRGGRPAAERGSSVGRFLLVFLAVSLWGAWHLTSRRRRATSP